MTPHAARQLPLVAGGPERADSKAGGVRRLA